MPAGSRNTRRALPRLTGRIFADLAIWMGALGVLIGLVFPYALTALNVPGRIALRPAFFAACVAAGIALAAMTLTLVRRVVGIRVDQLSDRMRYVATVIREATYSGDWERCSPEECQLPVDSEDQLGAAAEAFNELIRSLGDSRDVAQVMAELGQSLSEHLDLADFASATLNRFLAASGALAGGFCVVRDSGLELLARVRLDAEGLCESPAVLASMQGSAPVLIEVPTGLDIDASLLHFRPAAVISVPVRFRDVPLGLLLLACPDPPSSQTLSLLAGFLPPTAVALNNVLSHERFQRLAAVDPLTGAYNRRFGLSRLGEEWSRSVRTGIPLGLLGLDLDQFKSINDTFGHLAGDQVLREATALIRLALREGDVLVRTGGEEFLVVLPGGGEDDVRGVGERVRRTLAASPVHTAYGDIAISVSLGGASVPHPQILSCEEFLAATDRAMYSAKHAGRDRLAMHAFDPGVAAASGHALGAPGGS